MIDTMTQFLMGISVMLSLSLTCAVLILAIIWVCSHIVFIMRAVAGDRLNRKYLKIHKDHPYIQRGDQIDEGR